MASPAIAAIDKPVDAGFCAWGLTKKYYYSQPSGPIKALGSDQTVLLASDGTFGKVGIKEEDLQSYGEEY